MSSQRLDALVRIPSIAFPGFDPAPVHAMGAAVVDLFEAAGVVGVKLLDVPDGYPCVYADIPGPEGSPTVLLYAHYDVQPAPESQNWTSEPFEPVTKDDGRIYGRGAADDKSGLVIHYGTLKMLGADLPCHLKILVEGEEETISHLEAFVEDNPGLFAADAYVIADIGPQRVGRPGLTTALRGDVACTVTVRTLANPVHSGMFGGAAPDAMTAMIRILDTLHDENGDTTIAGVDSSRWEGADMDEAVYREGSAILPGVDFLGTGSLSDRIWAKPSVTVLGMDLPNVAEASNVLLPEVTAKLSMRIVPGADGDAQLEALMAHLRAQRPWNCEVDVREGQGRTRLRGRRLPPRHRRGRGCARGGVRRARREHRQRCVHPARGFSEEGLAGRGDPAVGGGRHRAVPHPRLRRIGRSRRDRADDRRPDALHPQPRRLRPRVRHDEETGVA